MGRFAASSGIGTTSPAPTAAKLTATGAAERRPTQPPPTRPLPQPGQKMKPPNPKPPNPSTPVARWPRTTALPRSSATAAGRRIRRLICCSSSIRSVWSASFGRDNGGVKFAMGLMPALGVDGILGVGGTFALSTEQYDESVPLPRAAGKSPRRRAADSRVQRWLRLRRKVGCRGTLRPT